jgi:hypothetical protein
MGVGDSLLEKIEKAISELDYLGVVISPYSAGSDWVMREVKIAMSEEVAGQRVKVLPLLLRGGELPPILTGKLWADFGSEPAYSNSLHDLLARLGVVAESDWDRDADPLTNLAFSSALLRSALAELRGDGISNATADALVSSTIADVELTEFLSLVARDLQGNQLFGLAISIPAYIDARGIGQEALDFCLNSGRLEDWQMASIGMHMQFVGSRPAVEWCHSRLTSRVRSDAY